MRAIEIQKVQQTAQVLVMGERSLHHRRPPEAPHVVADDPKAVGEGRELALPHPAVRDPRVYEDERLPFSRDLVVNLRAVDLGRTCLSKHVFPPPHTSTSSDLFPWRGRHACARASFCLDGTLR